MLSVHRDEAKINNVKQRVSNLRAGEKKSEK